MATATPITEYLLALLDELHVARRRRRRILAEVEDHLVTVAAELHADGLAPEEAEREAVRRFGSASPLARAFVRQEAARIGWRAAGATIALNLPLLLLLGPLGQPGGPGQGIVGFVLAQVAAAAGSLTVLRASRLREGVGMRRRLQLVLRAASVVAGCAAAFVLTDFAATGAHWTSPIWISRALVLAVAGATAAIVVRSRRWAARAGLTASDAPRAATTTGAYLAAGADLAAERRSRGWRRSRR